jgi:hypothetical protein
VESILARSLGALVLIASAGAKLARPRESRAALASFGIPFGTARRVAWAVLVVAELGLAIGIAAGAAVAAYAAAAMMLVFAAVLVGQILQGRAGLPCACFGPRGTIGWRGVLRNLLLAAFYGALPSIPEPRLATTGWLAVGLGVATVAICALAVALLALAREVGTLRLALGPESALEILHEGPEIGSRVDLDGRFEIRRGARVALAVFTSDGCPICSALDPSIRFLGRDPLVALRVFDEHRDADMWSALDVPGSPYAVALGLDGTVLAKGTFNSFAQLESVVATGVRRAEDAVNA